jgi:OmpA-OmpF porin, OOP family
MRCAILLAMTAFSASAGPASNEPTTICVPGPYTVYFDPASSAIAREAVRILDATVENAVYCGSITVSIAGHSDTHEPSTLAEDRVRGVRNYLAARGLFAQEKNLKAFGASRLRVETGPQVSERMNRRVEIFFLRLSK